MLMNIGITHKLIIVDRRQSSVVLDAAELGMLEVPANEASLKNVGDSLTVFIYTDVKGEPIATTRIPFVQRDQCASLKVLDITNAGAFLDWGLDKNLLLPFAEQRRPLQVGRYESVLVYLDNSGRLAATSRLDHHLPETSNEFRPWQSVSLLIYQRTDLGLKAVVDNCAIGLLYTDEIFKSVRVGETHTGFVKRLRFDGRIDLALQPPSKQLQTDLTDTIMTYLHDHDGTMPLGDKSSPDAIQLAFQVSKKNFKKALSTLYRERRILVSDDQVSLVERTPGRGTADAKGEQNS